MPGHPLFRRLVLSAACLGAAWRPPAAAADVGVAMIQDPATPGVGESVTYRIVVVNTGATTVTALDLSDTVPAVLGSVVTDQPAPFGAPPPVSNHYVWSSGGLFLVPGADLTFTLTGSVTETCGGPLTVTNAALAVAQGGTLVDVALSNPASFTVAPHTMSLAMDKTASPAGGAALATGAALSYCIAVTNTGSATLFSLTVTDTVPSWFEVATTIEAAPFFAPVVTDVPGTGTRYEWGAFEAFIGPGMTFTFTLQGTVVESCVPASFVNRAAADGYESACGRTSAAFSNDVAHVHTGFAPGITVSKEMTPAAAAAGDAVTYRIIVTNGGAAPFGGIIVVDTMPPGISATAFAQPPAWYPPSAVISGSATVYTWDTTEGGPLQPGQSWTFSAVGALGTNAVVSNRALVLLGSGNCSAALLTNEVHTAMPAALAAAWSLSATSVAPGRWVTASLVVTNTGESDATGVVPVAAPGAGGALVTLIGQPPAGSVTIGAGQSRTFTWTYSAAGAGSVELSATVTGTDARMGGALAATAGTAFTIRADGFAQAVNNALTQTESPITSFPNPVRGGDTVNLALRLQFDAASVLVEVFNPSFDLLYRNTFTDVEVRDGGLQVTGVRAWPPGVYLVRVTAVCHDGRRQVFPLSKVVVER